MHDLPFVGLVQNISLLLALVVVFESLWVRHSVQPALVRQVTVGVLLGGIGVVIMLTPWVLIPGVMFDTRSLLLSISGLFFGPLPATIAMAVTAAFRLSLGAGTIGLVWPHLRKHPPEKTGWQELYLFGLVTQLVMLALMLTLPWKTALRVLGDISLPVLTLYPLGTVLLGGLLVNRLRRETLQTALHQTTARLNATQQLSKIGGWEWETVPPAMFWTEETYRLHGLSPGDIPPHSTEHFQLSLACFDPADRPVIQTAFQNCVEKGLPYDLELPFTPRHGDRIWVRTKARAVVEQGKVVRVVGNLMDITERKRMEDALQKTQKLESLGVLAGGIAHDFNNLMGGIFGYIDMAREETREAKVTSYLTAAMNTIERARALTRQLLTFAKGGAPLQKIGDLFPFIQETVQFALSGSTVSCHFDVPPDLWAVNFDKNQIGQVIDNLIINALQAMPSGGSIELSARNITLAHQAHPILAKGDYVRLSVRDTGVGIPKEFLNRIFDPFFTTKTGGHGLGLATCYSIIKRHGGCIDVESVPGKGSTFTVIVPAATGITPVAGKTTVPLHRGSGRFLVMDDEKVMRDTLSGMLETLGYTVIQKENGQEAIEFFAAETKAKRTLAGMIFDLTVRGGMGGKEAVLEIRKANTDIPVFVASGYADDPAVKDPTLYGFTASISKPYRKSELSEMLSRHMP